MSRGLCQYRNSDRSPTPSIVDAGFHEVLVLLDAGVVEEIAGACRNKHLAWQPPLTSSIEHIRLFAEVAT